MKKKKNKKILFFLLILFFTQTLFFTETTKADEPSTWWNENYNHYIVLTTNASQTPENLNNFPILVSINTTIGSKCDNGNSIRFIGTDNTTEYNYEIESWDNKGNSYVWVNLTSLSSDGTPFLMYYNNTEATDNQNPINVWDSNFVLVTHMKDITANTIEDSTINNNDGTKKDNNEPIESDGQINTSQYFDGTDDYINCGNDNSLNIDTNDFTIELWYKGNTANGEKIITKREDGGNYQGFWILPNTRTANKISFEIRDDDETARYAVTNTDICNQDTWFYLAGTFDRNGNLKIYTNSRLDGTADISLSDNDIDTTNNLYLGSNRVPNNYGEGYIDEIRISTNILRTPSWIETTYNTIKNVTAISPFILWGKQQSQTADNTAPTATNENPTNNTNNIDICQNFSCYISDKEGNQITYSIECNNGYTNNGIQSNGTIYNNFTNCNFLGWNYTIWVNLSDGTLTNKYVYKFRTENLSRYIKIEGEEIMTAEIILLMCYIISVIMVLSNRYTIIALGVIIGMFLATQMHLNYTMFELPEFMIFSSVLFVAGGIVNALEKAIRKK